MLQKLKLALVRWCDPALRSAVDDLAAHAGELQRKNEALCEGIVAVNAKKGETVAGLVDVVVALLTHLGGEVTLSADLVKAAVGSKATFTVENREDGTAVLRLQTACQDKNCDCDCGEGK